MGANSIYDITNYYIDKKWNSTVKNIFYLDVIINQPRILA